MNKVDVIRNKDDIRKLKDYLMVNNFRNYLMFIVGINTGLRIKQILSLKFSDIVDEHNKIVDRITFNNISFSINDFVQECFQQYIKSNEEILSNKAFIFKSKKGDNPIERSQAYRILNDASKSVGINIKVGTHTLRKTFGYHFYMQNNDLKYLQKLFNHSSMIITADYIGINYGKIKLNYNSFNL